VARHAQERAEEVLRKLRPICDERLEQPPIGVPVRAQPARGLVQRAADEEGGAVVEGMGKRGRRLDEVKLERTEER